MFHRLRNKSLHILVCMLITLVILPCGRHAPALAAENPHLSATTLQELASARAGTAKYQDIEQAEADGYINIDLYLSGEGYHYVNPSLIDGTFDPAHPEVLLYVPVGDGTHMKLVGLEYLIPLGLSAGPPEGFTGDAEEWREDTEGFGFWEVNAWVWLDNPEGIFGHDNPRIP